MPARRRGARRKRLEDPLVDEEANGQIHPAKPLLRQQRRRSASIVVTKCPHVATVRPSCVKEALSKPFRWSCAACRTAASVQVCLGCGYLGCGREEVSQHALRHWESCGEEHCLAMSVADGSVFCYSCDEWCMDEGSRGEVSEIRAYLEAVRDQRPVRQGRRGALGRGGAEKVPEIVRLGSFTAADAEELETEDKTAAAVALHRRRVLARFWRAWRAESGAGRPTTAVAVMNGLVPGRVGLANLGNTCYMNSVVQCISAVPVLRELFLQLAPLQHDEAAQAREVTTSELRRLSRSHLALTPDIVPMAGGAIPPLDLSIRTPSSPLLSQINKGAATPSSSALGQPKESKPAVVLLDRFPQLARQETDDVHRDMEDKKAHRKAVKAEEASLSVSREFHFLLRLLWSGRWAVISPHKFFFAVWASLPPAFRSYRQQDAHEFFSNLAEAMHDELRSGGAIGTVPGAAFVVPKGPPLRGGSRKASLASQPPTTRRSRRIQATNSTEADDTNQQNPAKAGTKRKTNNSSAPIPKRPRPTSSSETPPKRKPGRPRKSSISSGAAASVASSPTPTKQRARPKKSSAAAAAAASSSETPPKRKPGRPRKSSISSGAAASTSSSPIPKKQRGRPQKSSSISSGAAASTSSSPAPTKQRGRPKKSPSISSAASSPKSQRSRAATEKKPLSSSSASKTPRRVRSSSAKKQKGFVSRSPRVGANKSSSSSSSTKKTPATVKKPKTPISSPVLRPQLPLFAPTAFLGQSLFGAVVTQTTCRVCGRISEREEVFASLSVDMDVDGQFSIAGEGVADAPALTDVAAPSNRRARSARAVVPSITLGACLRRTTASSELEDYACENCCKNVPASTRVLLRRLPRVLVIHVNRALWTSNGGKRKQQHHVQFPLQGLSLADFVDEHAVLKGFPTYDPRQATYDLYGVVAHAGRGVDSGHYTAFCLTPPVSGVGPNEWSLLDDRHVHPATTAQVALSQAYLLFYQCREIH